MRERIINDLTSAMKAQNKELLSVIRMVKGAMQMEELNVKRNLTDDEVISIIAKQIKTRKESIVEFEKGNRSDLIAKTKEEITILSDYLPEQLTEEEIMISIDEAFNTLNPTGNQDMGKIIGFLSPKLKGKADMGMVSKIVKERLMNI